MQLSLFSDWLPRSLRYLRIPLLTAIETKKRDYQQEELREAIIREHFETELRQAQTAIAIKDFESAWAALQRSHILAQAYPFPHAIVH